ncbi:ATP-binding protein [Streptomyces sp. NBC_00370]|uniref:ATP-binding protein n=2 Tax=unclassified Streptomyces TaxID=2593676 RepID=UPI002E257332
MRISVLGTTRALHDDGTPVALGGARLRALLTALALRPGRTVPVAVLVAEVWDGDPPADAVGAVQALVGRLRRALGPGAVASYEGGYQLGVDAEDVDLHRFGRLADEGARALRAGDPAKAAGLLDDALALWHGPALTDLPERAPDAVRWETRRVGARKTRLAAALALGGAEESLPELAALCDEFPLDEPLQALRIRALRDASRTAEALAAYEHVRHALADRLGADPGPELTALHQELLHEGHEPPPAPAPLQGARPAPAGAPARARGNLRARLTSFVGRESDIGTLHDDLGRARLVTLLGPGGAGKTRLSQEAAEAMAEQWPDGVWLAELAPVDDPKGVPEAVLTALGARETVLRGAGAEELRAVDRHSGDPLARLAEHCARRRMLLILDNCEHVIEAAATLAEELLAHCPELTVLATSREPLGVPGEALRPVEPLPRDPAHRLFAERARAVRPGFDPADDPAAVAEICRRLDGLPLAIELAAARLRLLTPRQIADRLDDRFRLLTSGSRTVLPRQQTLRAVVDWSWELLDLPERAVLRRLSVFSGGCDLTAAESVCAGPGVPAREVAALLGSLIDKSLVVAAPSEDGGMRYRLLETVTEYTAERLDEADDRQATERRHLTYYRELARTSDPELRGSGQRAALARLELENENVRTALRRAVAAEDEQEVLCLVLSLAWYWQMRDLRFDAMQWASAGAALGPDPFAPPYRPAEPLQERCTDAPPPMSPEVLLEARREVRLIELVSMDHSDSEWSMTERVEWFGAVSEVYRAGLPQTCRFPGTMWFFSMLFAGEGERLLAALNTTVSACEDFGFDWELAAALQTRANLLANRGISAEDAARDADRAREIYERLGDDWGAAEALSAHGEARERAGDFDGAVEDFTAAIRYAEGLGARGHVTLLRCRLGGNLLESDHPEEGERILREALAEGEEAADERPDREPVPIARLFLAMWLGRSGRRDEAREQLELLQAALAQDSLAVFEGFAKGAFAWLDCADGDFARARVLAREAAIQANAPLSRMIAPEMVAVHLLTAAWALGGLGGERAEDAARLIGAYEALLPTGHFRVATERMVMRGAREAVLASLGGDTARFDAARAEGGGLTMEEAVALV